MKIPKYVDELLGRFAAAPQPQQDDDLDLGLYGYVFRLYRRNNSQRSWVFGEEAERFAVWANSCHAEAKILRSVWFDDKEHRKPYYKKDYYLLAVSEPATTEAEIDAALQALAELTIH